jgi:hypothetical protein
VLVHIDPEDDASERPNKLLPGREEMLQRLERRWRDSGVKLPVERVNLHYLKGVVDVEIVLPLGAADDLGAAKRLSSQLAETTGQEPLVGEVTVFFV